MSRRGDLFAKDQPDPSEISKDDALAKLLALNLVHARAGQITFPEAAIDGGEDDDA